MKISKLLSIILGRSGFLRMGIVGEGGGGDLSMFDAGSALAGIDPDPGEGEEETEEAAAERLAAEQAEGATQPGDEAELEAQASAAASEKITIEVDGKTIELNKADLPELYKNGLRQKDYTAKTMEVSEQRKAAEAETNKARADREDYARKLLDFKTTTTSILEEQAKTLTQELLDTDPQEYLRQQHTFQQRQVELNKANVELQRLHGEYEADQKQQHRQFIADQNEALIAAGLIDAKDGEKSKKFFAAMDDYLEKVGFKPEDGRMLLDARTLVMADKAQKYDALMAKVKESSNKVKSAPVKVERPGVTQVAPTDGRTKGMSQLAKTGSVRDAGAVLAGLM